MTSKLTRERIEQYANDPRMCNINDEIREMARMALTAMDSEPVAEVLSNRPGNDTSTIDRALPVGTQLYRHAQLAPERDQVRNEHAEWSQATFGNVVPVGPLKHLSKEALEAVAEPDDLSEWADMQSLLWDAQRRAGITDEQITQAMIEKLVVNKQREWPEPKDEEPRLHIKEQPAPVVPPMQHWEELCRQYPDMSIRDAIIRAAWWNHCRAAMLQAGNSPAHSGLCPEQGSAPPAQDGCSPAQNQGWIPVGERMPGSQEWVIVFAKWANQQVLCWDDVQNRWTDFEDQSYYADMFSHWMPLPAAPQEVKGE
ncbi:dATP/dGTP pyrophosphohydrolase domain-containing protein [Raoultella ornithinolytica]|uniref:dATP/dGTP pyrophosphohydrolase domain-containing protein n=1 Tax=Raoultella ornithinolytica TaxID=54291 RepID=UPI00384A517E